MTMPRDTIRLETVPADAAAPAGGAQVDALPAGAPQISPPAMPRGKPADIRVTVLLFAALLTMDTAADLIQKTAANHAAPSGSDWGYYLSLISHPWVWAAIALTPLQLWAWTRILATVDLSLAYPITSLGTPLTMIAAVVLLHERLPWPVWLGAGLVTAGVIVLGGKHDGE